MKPDTARIETMLRSLVAVPSVTGDEYDAQDLVADMLTDMGMEVERLDIPIGDVEDHPDFPGIEVERTSLPIVAGRWQGSRPGRRVMIVGHVDVVPPGDPNTWTTPAFEPDVRDGRMYGRGTCDMKGGVVAGIEACRLAMAASDVGEIVLLAVPSEEDGGSGAMAAILAGYTADACVIPEPTNGSIITAHAGAITFTLDVPGKAAHASVRREGVSALANLTYLIGALTADETSRNQAETHPLMKALGLPYPTIIGQVEGGTWASTVMDRVIAHGRYGVTIGQDVAGAEADLRAAIHAAATNHDFMRERPPIVTVWGGQFDSAALPTDHSLPQRLQQASETLGYGRPPLEGVPYGADMRLFINKADTPTVMYGPGDVRVAHSANEFVPLDEVSRCAEVLAKWMVDELNV